MCGEHIIIYIYIHTYGEPHMSCIYNNDVYIYIYGCDVSVYLILSSSTDVTTRQFSTMSLQSDFQHTLMMELQSLGNSGK